MATSVVGAQYSGLWFGEGFQGTPKSHPWGLDSAIRGADGLGSLPRTRGLTVVGILD